MGTMAVFEKITAKSKGMIKATTTLIGISISVLILASAMKKLSDLDWGQIGRGLTGVLGLMAIVVAAAKILSTDGKRVQKGATQMVIMAAALKILASVCSDLSKLNWEQLAKGVSGITGILLSFAVFQALMKKIQPEKMLRSATSLILIGAAMEILADVCNKFGNMDWPDLGKAGAAVGGLLLLASGFMLLSGLANGVLMSVVSLTIISAAMEILADVCNKFGNMKWEELGKAGAAVGGLLLLASGFALLAGLSSGMLASSAALLVMAAALAIFTPILVTLGGMSFGSIATGLFAIAGAFAILGAAGALLGPLVPSILALSGAIALFGVGCLAAGVGIMAFAAGFATLSTATAAGATAIVAALSIIIVGILELIPQIIGALTDAVVALCDVFIQSAPAIGEAIKALILTAIDVLVECVPALAEGLLQIILGALDALATYAPQIVAKLFEILKGVVESAVDALGSIDPATLLTGIAAMTGLMVALNMMTALAAGAMLGVLAFGAVIVELTAVIAAIGAIAQIPGLDWLISEGGNFLQKIGTAIGQFVGGIVGGVAEGVTSSLPEVASNLSNFMTQLTPFIEGAKSIDESAMSGVKTLADTILTLTGAGILESITSWLTGGSSLSDFGAQLTPFGESIKSFSDAVSGIDVESVTAAAEAGKLLAEMASTLPNSGGVAGFFAGENDIGDFAEQLGSFGEAIADFSSSVDGNVNLEAITNAVEAGKKIIEMASEIPNSGGVAGFFAGENDMGDFRDQLSDFGNAIADFSSTVDGSVSTEAISNVVDACKSISEISIDANISGLTTQLNDLGKGLKDFLNSIKNVDTSGLNSFSQGLKNVANSGINELVQSFNNAKSKVTSSINGMMTSALNTLKSKQNAFKNA